MTSVPVMISMRSIDRMNGWRTSLMRCRAASSRSARLESIAAVDDLDGLG